MITWAVSKAGTCSVFCTLCDTVHRRRLSKVEVYIFVKYEMRTCPACEVSA